MDDLHKLKSRRQKLSTLRDRTHVRIVSTNLENNRFLQTEVDEKALASSDMSEEYSKRIKRFNPSVSNQDVAALLDSLDEKDPMGNILEPVFLSLFDGTMRAFKIGTQQGLTASRLYSECKSFSYDKRYSTNSTQDSYNEFLNERENISSYGNTAQYKNGNLVRNGIETKMRDGAKMSQAHQEHFKGQATAPDGYDSTSTIYENVTHAKGVGKTQQSAEVDHARPCAEICRDLKNNKGLSDEDIKSIVNIKENLVVTSRKNNSGKNIGKFDKSADQIQKEIDSGYISNRDGSVKHKLTPDEITARKNMVQRMQNAEKATNKATNAKVAENIFSLETFDEARLTKEFKESQQANGNKVTDKAIKAHLDKKKAEIEKKHNVKKRLAGDALSSTAHQSLGDVIIFMIKPLYFELKDCFINGIEAGVNASTFKNALSYRFGRMKNFVVEHAGSMLKDSVFNFFKNFLSMLLEGIVNCFVGIFKSIFRMVKEGFKILMQVVPILKNKESSMAEKGDAILKLVASGLTIFASIGIESWLNSLGIGEPWSIIISSVLTAVVTSLTMYVLDKMDIFKVKEDARLKRIDEILTMKIDESENEILSMAKALS